VDTESYLSYGTDRFLARAFMKYGWDLYAPDPKTRDNPYVSPLRASLDQLRGLPAALVITADCPTPRWLGPKRVGPMRLTNIDL
jgi:acetyl esterase/lipase